MTQQNVMDVCPRVFQIADSGKGWGEDRKFYWEGGDFYLPGDPSVE